MLLDRCHRLCCLLISSRTEQPLPSIETPGHIQTGDTYNEPIDLSSEEYLTPDSSSSSQSTATTLDQDSARVWHSGSLSLPSRDNGYESDRTDFRKLSQEAQEVETPCPTYTAGTKRVITTKTSRSQSYRSSRVAKPVERKLFQRSSFRKLIKRPRGIEYRQKNHSMFHGDIPQSLLLANLL